MHDNNGREGNVYTASFNASAISTNAFDLFGVYASTNPISRVEILSIDLGVPSSAGPASQVDRRDGGGNAA